MIYLDYHATTPLCDKAKDSMSKALQSYANPHSQNNYMSDYAANLIEENKIIIADYIGASPDEIYFTSGATESNNLALLGLAYSGEGRKKIIVSEIEHKCVLECAKILESKFNFELVKVRVTKQGKVDLKHLREIIDDKTLIVSVMAVNNEIGVNQPIKEIGELCNKHGALFHVDASQALYKEIDVYSDNIDLLSLSSHKLYGPKGIGALYINRYVIPQITPLIYGGGQQNNIRAGTLSTELIVGFAGAILELQENLESESARLKKLSKKFLELLSAKIPFVELNGSEDRHPGNINVSIKDLDSSLCLSHLYNKLAISTSSACSNETDSLSHVLYAIGLSPERIKSSIRVSIGRYTTEEEVLGAISLITDSYTRQYNT